MSAKDTPHKAAAVRIEHTGRSVDALEWSSASSVFTVVIAVDGDVTELVSPVAEKLMHRARVIGVNLRSAWDPVTVAWWAQDPVVLLAQGDAGRLACETARLAPGALKALVLADSAPGAGSGGDSGLAIPVLVFQGRDSSAGTHANAVSAKDAIPGSQLIELDGCADLPTKNCPTALSESLLWYLDSLGKSSMEFTEFAGSEKEPVDPKG